MDPEQIPLRDLHLPEAIGWWPLAPGWWILIVLAVSGLLYLMYRGCQRWRSHRPRRIALRELRKLQNDYRHGADAISLSKQLSQLLRRAMLAYASRDEVAGLTGQSWLEWLDRGLEGKPFTNGPGRWIGSLPYVRTDSEVAEADIAPMIDAVRARLKTPLEGAGA
ncbi:MAG TPA: DUF4381 domain-containing protein [Woeseiaceae bacterium]|nr:DUF4381 domain-containing protein [Woeseiaceae bacterium]